MRSYRLSVIPGDGIGREVAPGPAFDSGSGRTPNVARNPSTDFSGAHR